MSANSLTISQAFYDIESLNNVFTLCNFKPADNSVDVYILADDAFDTKTAFNIDTPVFVLTPEIQAYITERIYKSNNNFHGSVNYYDLATLEGNLHLINMFGAKDDDGCFEKLASKNLAFSMFVNDTDANYSDQIHPYLFGYNSLNYDTTMLALYINEAFWELNGEINFKPPTARLMRDYNNELFSPAYKEQMPAFLKRTKNNGNSGYGNRENVIRTNMLKSGRYIDVALLNEKMQKIALKRVLGMLGFQILQSEKVSDRQSVIHTIDELADLIAYNVSDVVNLRELFNHPVYQSNFELKKGLLSSYPELVYNRQKDKYAPDVRPGNARSDRLYIDSSSAKLAARALCPYDTLNDIEAVSFMYPSEKKSKELGIPRINVLDECRKFFYGLYPDKPELLTEFDRIYFYYKNNIEGRNFNNSDEYVEYYKNIVGPENVKRAYSMSEIPKQNLTLPYFNKDGSVSSCYVVFGTGGIHGAEYNYDLYQKDKAAFDALEHLHNTVRALYPDPRQLRQKDPVTKKAWKFVTAQGVEYKSTEFLKTGSTKDKAEWKDISKKKPVLFKRKEDGSYELNKKYTYTSAADSNHEDFTSYYPNLLIMMSAFYNEGLGYDRYAEIFENKQKYGKLMKDKSLSEAERYHYDILRNGTKLILNSASGAGDANFFTPIRMNNQIMSMRIIGQLFTWRIGQAQTYEGAKIISTNTDGLFSVCEPVRNAEILAREAANINVEIEPEFCRLVSKDTNNRLELDENRNIITASGGSLACYKRPNPTKALAHAAIIDWCLCEYLRSIDDLSKPFDMDLGRKILNSAKSAFKNPADYLLMFQTIVASSTGSQTYVYGETPNLEGYKSYITNPAPETLASYGDAGNAIDSKLFDKRLFEAACESNDIKILQHYNRAFFVKPEYNLRYNKPVIKLRNACSRAVTPASKITRARNNEESIQHDRYALAVLEKFGITVNDIPNEREAKISKVSGIDLDWLVFIENHNLFLMNPDERQLLIDNLNLEEYLTLAADSFNKNWKNETGIEGVEIDDAS